MSGTAKDVDAERLSKYWRALRIIIGVSQAEFADFIGRSRTTVSDFETGKIKFTRYDYHAFRDAYEEIAFGIEDTRFYLDLWDIMIYGSDFDPQGEITYSEEERDELYKTIIELNDDPKVCPKCYPVWERAQKIKKLISKEKEYDDD